MLCSSALKVRLGARFGATAARGTEAITGTKRADDGLRTRDLQLGKLALYQLSYVRVSVGILPPRT
jgi:hypothetical protein